MDIQNFLNPVDLKTQSCTVQDVTVDELMSKPLMALYSVSSLERLIRMRWWLNCPGFYTMRLFRL